MESTMMVPRRRLVRHALALAAVVGAATAAAADADVTVAVHAERFTIDGSAYHDMDALATAVAMRGARSATLAACGPQAVRALLAGVHRLRHLPLQLRVLDADAPACTGTTPALVRVRHGAAAPLAVDDTEVDRFWRRRMP